MAEEMNNDAGQQQQQQEKTYTQADIDALTSAKNKERDAANAANAKVRELEKQMLELQSKTYGDEDKIKGSPLYKNIENELKKRDEEIASITASLKLAQDRLDEEDLAKELSKNAEIQPTAVGDIIMHLRANGFVKTEKGWLSKEGSNVSDFVKTLHASHPHFFKKTIGSSQLYTNDKLKTMSAREKDPHAMLVNLFSN